MKASLMAGIASLLWFTVVLPAPATTYYVAQNGGGAGTPASPYATVQAAANVAKAGDTVIIENGTYNEDVTVQNSGAQGNPIIFQAQSNQGAILYSMKPANGNVQYWVTVQGVDFKVPTTNPTLHWMYITTGWDFENCTFEGKVQMAMIGTNTANMGYITVNHCVFQDCYAGSFGGYGGGNGNINSTDLLHDVKITNSIVRRSNLSNTTDTYWDGGVDKFMYTKNLLISGLIAYDNNGTAIWLDTNNQNFQILGCTCFGNHSGWYYLTKSANETDPRANGLENNTNDASDGIDVEANPGPGLIDSNALYSNSHVGVLQNSSGNGYGVSVSPTITITNNIFADNTYHLWYAGEVGPELTRGPGPTTISGNTFYAWGWEVVQGFDVTKAPASYGVKMSGNTYNTGISGSATWGAWSPFDSTNAYSLADLQNVLQLEDGTSLQKSLGSFPGELPSGTISISPSQTAASNAAPNQAPAVSEITTPTSSIDTQIASLPSNQAMSVPATITVYGHTILTASGSNYTCEVYDLQGRWVGLTLPASSLSAFKAAVLPYATINVPATISVNVTYKSPYLVTATYPVVSLNPHSIGSVGQTGSASQSSGTYTVQGSGADIFGTADACEYDCQTLTGDGTIIARVASVSDTNAWAKAGVMIRADYSTPGAAQVAMFMTPTSGNGWIFEDRTTTGASTGYSDGTGIAPPYWVKLVRAGNVFTGSTSLDGTNWSSGTSQTVVMSNPVQIGLGVCSHNNSVLCTAKFDNVSITTP